MDNHFKFDMATHSGSMVHSAGDTAQTQAMPFSGRSTTVTEPSKNLLIRGLEKLGKSLKTLLEYIIKPFTLLFEYIQTKVQALSGSNESKPGGNQEPGNNSGNKGNQEPENNSNNSGNKGNQEPENNSGNKGNQEPENNSGNKGNQEPGNNSGNKGNQEPGNNPGNKGNQEPGNNSGNKGNQEPGNNSGNKGNQKPGNNSGIGSQKPGNNSGIGSQKPGNNSGIGSQKPGNNSGIGSQKPGNNSGIGSQKPGNNSGIGSQKPGNNSGIGSQKPGNNSGIGNQKPGNNSGIGSQKPGNNSGIGSQKPGNNLSNKGSQKPGNNLSNKGSQKSGNNLLSPKLMGSEPNTLSGCSGASGIRYDSQANTPSLPENRGQGVSGSGQTYNNQTRMIKKSPPRNLQSPPMCKPKKVIFQQKSTQPVANLSSEPTGAGQQSRPAQAINQPKVIPIPQDLEQGAKDNDKTNEDIFSDLKETIERANEEEFANFTQTVIHAANNYSNPDLMKSLTAFLQKPRHEILNSKMIDSNNKNLGLMLRLIRDDVNEAAKRVSSKPSGTAGNKTPIIRHPVTASDTTQWIGHGEQTHLNHPLPTTKPTTTGQFSGAGQQRHPAQAINQPKVVPSPRDLERGEKSSPLTSPVVRQHNLNTGMQPNPAVKLIIPVPQSCEARSLYFLNTIALKTDEELENFKRTIIHEAYKSDSYVGEYFTNLLHNTQHELLQQRLNNDLDFYLALLRNDSCIPQDQNLIEAAALNTVVSGKLFNAPYIFEKKLGEGANAEVFLMKNTANDLPVVMKITNKSLLDNEDFFYLKNKLGNTNQFVRGEGIGLSKELKCDHCPKVIGLIVYDKSNQTLRLVNESRPTSVNKDNDIIYGVITSYTEGAQSADNFFVGKKDPDLVKTFAKKGFESLAHLHENGVYHNDIKPHNMLVKKDPHAGLLVPIIDFQESCVSDGHKMRPLAGTAYYGSPEKFAENDFEVGPNPCLPGASDVWEMGTTVFLIMAGYFHDNPYADDMENSPLRDYIQIIRSKQTPCTKFSDFLKQSENQNIQYWLRRHPAVFALLDQIFVPEEQRISAKEAAEHQCWNTKK